MDIDVKKLQRHFNDGAKDGFQAKVHYQVNDRHREDTVKVYKYSAENVEKVEKRNGRTLER